MTLTHITSLSLNHSRGSIYQPLIPTDEYLNPHHMRQPLTGAKHGLLTTYRLTIAISQHQSSHHIAHASSRYPFDVGVCASIQPPGITMIRDSSSHCLDCCHHITLTEPATLRSFVYQICWRYWTARPSVAFAPRLLFARYHLCLLACLLGRSSCSLLRALAPTISFWMHPDRIFEPRTRVPRRSPSRLALPTVQSLFFSDDHLLIWCLNAPACYWGVRNVCHVPPSRLSTDGTTKVVSP